MAKTNKAVKQVKTAEKENLQSKEQEVKKAPETPEETPKVDEEVKAPEAPEESPKVEEEDKAPEAPKDEEEKADSDLVVNKMPSDETKSASDHVEEVLEIVAEAEKIMRANNVAQIWYCAKRKYWFTAEDHARAYAAKNKARLQNFKL